VANLNYRPADARQVRWPARQVELSLSPTVLLHERAALGETLPARPL